MGVASSPGPDRPYPGRRRSIRSSFAVVVAVPVVLLVAVWAVAVLLTPGGSAVRNALLMRGSHTDMAEAALYAGGGLIILLLGIILMGLYAGRVSRDVSGLEMTARRLADEKLPQMMMRLRNEGPIPEADQSMLRPRARTAEISRAAAAIADLQQTAIAAASDEASLRNGVAQVFVSLARRNQSLLQRQLRLIDTLERKAADPTALADLFLLDHLTTRMRRHAENLIILSGANPGRSWSAPVPVIDVIRGAAAEVEDYQRIRVVTRTQDTVTGSAVADLIHLLAELVENAALFSPSDTRVDVRAERVANGFVVEVEDRGLGVQGDLLRQINHQLANPPDFALADPDRLGLFVVAKLAARHGIRVTLSASPYGGTTAVALIPHTVVLPASELGLDMRHPAGELTGGPAGPDLGSGEAVVLTGRTATAWTAPPGDLAERPEPGRPAPGPEDSGALGTVSPIGTAASASASRSLDLGAPFDASDPLDRGGQHEPGPSVIAAALSPAGLPARGGQQQPPPPTMGNSPAFPDLPTLGDVGRGQAAAPDSARPAGLPARGGPPPSVSGPRPGLGGGPAPGADGPRPGLGGRPDRDGSFTPSGLPSRGSVFASNDLPARGPFTPGNPGAHSAPPGPGTGTGSAGSGPAGAPLPGGRGPAQPARSSAAGTYRGLPRRVRQANLSPHLVNTAAADTPEPTLSPAPVPAQDRTPEEARAFVASFRTGWQRDDGAADDSNPRDEDRADTLGNPAGHDGARVTEQQDSAASQTEER